MSDAARLSPERRALYERIVALRDAGRAVRDGELWRLPGVRSWDDPTWVWAVQVPLPFGMTLRVGKGGRG